MSKLISVSDEVHARARAVAKRAGCSLSFLVAGLLKDALGATEGHDFKFVMAPTPAPLTDAEAVVGMTPQRRMAYFTAKYTPAERVAFDKTRDEKLMEGVEGDAPERDWPYND